MHGVHSPCHDSRGLPESQATNARCWCTWSDGSRDQCEPATLYNSFLPFLFYSLFSFNKFFHTVLCLWMLKKNFCISYTHSLSLQNKLCAQLVVTKKSYAHNSLLQKNLCVQIILQTIVHTSCTHKLRAPSNLYLKIIWQNLQFEVMHRNCVYKFQKWKIEIMFGKSYAYKSCFKTIVHTNCMRKFYMLTSVKVMLKSLRKIYKSNLSIKFMYISYNISEIEICGNKNFSKKGKFGRESDRSPASQLAPGR
jgi:hypothetical protein